MILYKAIINYIKDKSIKRIYGLSGKYNEPIFIEAEKNNMEIIQNIHENNSVFFASGDYEASSNINFVFATKGPGITNLITATSCAYIDNIPLIIISINNQTHNYSLGTHHDSGTSIIDGIDIVGFMTKVTSYSTLLINPNSLIETLNRAYNIALNSKKPVHISIPEDLLYKDIKYINKFINTINKVETINDILKINNDINKSKFPLFIVGDNIEKKYFLNFIKKYNILYTTTISNNNLFIRTKYYIGNIDLVQSEYISKIINKSDLIIVMNTRLDKFSISWYFRKLKTKKIIHISNNKDDISSLNLNNYYFHNGNPNVLFKNLNKNMLTKWDKNNDLINRLYTYYNKIFIKQQQKDYYNFYDIINKNLKKDDIVYISVGGLHIYGGLFLRVKNGVKTFFPGRFFSLGTSMRACGHSLSTKNKVFLLIGDGDFIMNGIDTFILNNKNIFLNIILYNNNGYKSLNNEQYNDFGNKLNFKKISEGLGLNYYYSNSKTSLEKQINNLNKKGVNLIDYKTF